MAFTILSHTFLSPAGASYAYDTNVPVDYKLKLTFSDNINAASINSSTVALVEVASDSILTGPDVVTIWDRSIGEGGAFKTNALPNRIPITWDVSGAILTVTPSIALDPEKTYQLVLTSGVSSYIDLTAIENTKTGTGEAPVVEGVHSHTDSHTMTITIVTAGVAGVATFNWESDGGTYYRNGATTSEYFQELSNWDTTPATGEPGIQIKFGTGTYAVNDSWSYGLHAWSEFLAATNVVQFTTIPKSSLVDVPGAIPPVIEPPISGQRIVGGYAATTPALTIIGLSTEADSYNITPPTTLTVTFNKNIDATTATTSTVKVYGNSVFADADTPSPEGAEISTDVSVSGATITITIDITDVGDNNELKLYLASSISSTGESPELTLGANNYFYFYTQFDPFYSTVELLRLEYGSLLADISDITLAKLIYQYSTIVDVLNKTGLAGEAFEQVANRFVHCSIINQLIKSGALDLPGGNSKSLGDLRFSNQISNNSLSAILLKDVEKCLNDVQMLLAGGQNMVTFVRAQNHVDTPLVGRIWVNLENYPGAPNYYLYSGSRRLRRGW